MLIVIAALAGLSVGGCLGLIVGALCAAARRAEEQFEHLKQIGPARKAPAEGALGNPYVP